VPVGEGGQHGGGHPGGSDGMAQSEPAQARTSRERGFVVVRPLWQEDLRGGHGHTAETDPRRHHGSPDPAVGNPSRLLGLAAAGERPRQVGDVPSPPRQHLVGVLEPAGQGEDRHPDEPERHVQGQDPRQREHAVVLQEAGQGGAVAFVPCPWSRRGPGAVATGRCVAVTGHGTRRHQHPVSRHLRPPAEVEVVRPAGQAIVRRADAVAGPA